MRKNTLNFAVDVITLLVMLTMVATGLVMKYALPPGSGGKGLMLWTLTRHEWGDVHFWLSVAIAALLVLHVLLHWAWVCGTIRRLMGFSQPVGTVRRIRENALAALSLAALCGLVVGFVLLARSQIVQSDAAAREHEAQEANLIFDEVDDADAHARNEPDGDDGQPPEDGRGLRRGQGRGAGLGSGGERLYMGRDNTN
jgi:hypothetical protein